MSQENVELHRRAMAAYNARDIEAFIAYCHPEIEFHSVMDAIGGGVYRGHDGLRSYHRDAEETWGDDIRLKPEAYFDLGEHTLSFLVARGRGSQSGAEVVLTLNRSLPEAPLEAVGFWEYAGSDPARGRSPVPRC